MRTEKEIKEMIDKLYTILNSHPEQTLRIITYNDCLSWVLGEDYLDQFIEDVKAEETIDFAKDAVEAEDEDSLLYYVTDPKDNVAPSENSETWIDCTNMKRK